MHGFWRVHLDPHAFDTSPSSNGPFPQCPDLLSPMWILSSLYPSPSLNRAFVNLKSNQEVAFLCLPSSWTFSVTRSSQSTQQICDGSDHWAPLSAIPQLAHLAVMSSNLITLDLGSLRIKSLRKEMAGVWNFLESQAEKSVCLHVPLFSIPRVLSLYPCHSYIVLTLLLLHHRYPSQKDVLHRPHFLLFFRVCVQKYAHVWKVNLECCSLGDATLVLRASLDETWDSCLRLGWLALLSLSFQSWYCKYATTLRLLCEFWGANLEPSICATSTSPTEPSPQLLSSSSLTFFP